MRNVLAFLAAALLVFLGLGWYLDWYSFKSVPAGSPGHQSINIDINKDKISSDVQKGEKKLQDAIDKRKESTSAPSGSPAPAAAVLKDAKKQFEKAASHVILDAEEATRPTGLTTGGPGGSGPISH